MRGRRRHSPAAVALIGSAFLLAGCQGPDRQDTTTAPDRRSSAASTAADYAACRERAGGDARLLVACADAAVAAAAVDADAAGMAALGSAAQAQVSGSLSDQVAVAHALASFAIDRARLRDGVPLPRADEQAVPAALARAAAPLVADTCVGASEAAACERARERLLPRFAARLSVLASAKAGTETKSVRLGGYAPPTCEAVRRLTPDAALAVFESEFPAALKDERLVETIMLSEDQVGDVAAYLACLAEHTGFAPDVIDSSLTFFASRQSGATARKALHRLGKAPGNNAAAAREFASQVTDYLAAPEG